MYTLITFALTALASLPAAANAQAAPRATCCDQAAAVLPLGRDWIVKTADNVCGLRDANQLTQPVLIDFDACLEATQEMKKIESQGIDPRSAEGIQLHSAAVSRITRAAEAVRTASGYCSVWKQIHHKDGRAITDITTQVIAQF